VKSIFELFAFYSNEESLRALSQTKLTGFVVDLEKKGKELRQQLYDTQITEHTQEDLVSVRKATNKSIICRINNHQKIDRDELEQTIDNGADELLIPMIRNVKELEAALGWVDGPVKVSAMLETVSILNELYQLNHLPLERCYVGLNDLSIERKSRNLFVPLVDGTMEKIAEGVQMKLGVAGLTHPDLGKPIPCQWIIQFMKNFNCSFGILRRSFYRDLQVYSAAEIISSLLNEFEAESVPLLNQQRVSFIEELTL